jgi:hypothetical protein
VEFDESRLHNGHHGVEVQVRLRASDHSGTECGDLLRDDVNWHVILVFDMSEATLDSVKSDLVFDQLLLQFRSLEQEHSPQLLGAQLVEQRRQLTKRQAQFLEGHDAVQAWQLMGREPALAGRRVDGRGRKKPSLLVVAQRPNRHPTGPSEVSDTEHDRSSFQVFRYGRVKLGFVIPLYTSSVTSGSECRLIEACVGNRNWQSDERDTENWDGFPCSQVFWLLKGGFRITCHAFPTAASRLAVWFDPGRGHGRQRRVRASAN